ncbi:hypothetical protein ABT169_08255 [Streptomyces sp. NPDC001616]|uniref:hypothetical protein n=1 Tax=Streptomyces sp. NPDC001616 TaxID=3156648 RepID=UPI003319253E
MPEPYPNEFREDVMRVARNREPGVTLEQIAADFGVHPTSEPWNRPPPAANRSQDAPCIPTAGRDSAHALIAVQEPSSIARL